MRRNIIGVIILAFSGVVYGFDFGPGYIDVPPGFKGPISQDLGSGAKTMAFAFQYSDKAGALLQISVIPSEEPITELNNEEMKLATKKYLGQFMQGIEGRRKSFSTEPIEFIDVSGVIFAKSTWHGIYLNQNSTGVLYCAITDSKVLSFHTQDFDASNGAYIKRAVNSIESVRFKR